MTARPTIHIAWRAKHFGGDPRVSIFTKTNGGKAEALNFGWRKAKGEIVIALDADTLFTPQTISALAHRFADATIGAVAGNAKVGNRINHRHQMAGARIRNVAEFRPPRLCVVQLHHGRARVRSARGDASVLEETGGFSSDTLAEDQDLTIQVRKLGYTHRL